MAGVDSGVTRVAPVRVPLAALELPERCRSPCNILLFTLLGGASALLHHWRVPCDCEVRPDCAGGKRDAV